MKGLLKIIGAILGILGLSGKATAKKKAKVKKIDKKVKQVKTAVKAVLSTVYSTDCRKNKDIEQKLTVEKDSQNQHTSLLHAGETFDAKELVAA